MPLSRLENFLKNVDGNIIYVNPSDLDSTDSIENQGNSQTKPFKTLQRALIEAARFSYNIGVENDRFDRTTILLMPGTYILDNRPGFSVVDSSGTASFRDVNGQVQTVLQLTNNSNYDIEDADNDLYKFNSVEGGIIVPRGTSIVGLDLRKTKIRPKYVPDPYTATVKPASIFKITGGCYFWQFSIFDGDINGSVYFNNTRNLKAPTFSHHKLSCFEYADGVNGVGIGTSSGITDLQMYYYKLTRAYGATSGRDILDYPAGEDFQPSIPEFKIVGAVNANDIGISSAAAVSANPLTVTVDTSIDHGLSKDDVVRISGFTSTVYNGSWVVVGVSSDKRFQVNIGAIPATAGVVLTGDEKAIIEPDNVNGASPYIFNCSLRSTYGMNGLHGDGSKASGFKSIVVAQFTGISLQRDDNAFVIYNRNTGTYQDNDTAINAGISSLPLHLNSSAIYKPDYETYHVRVSNSSFIQAVSIFSIGFSQHFLVESGGDISITNSNSNFGARSLVAKGFQERAFDRDDVGYITHIIPPKDIATSADTKTWLSLNVGLTTNAPGISTTNRIYLFGSTRADNPPPHIVDSFSVGAKRDEILYVNVATATSEVTLSAPILMPIPSGADGPTSEKEFKVIRVGAANSITSGNTLNLEAPHTLFTGESVRVLSDNGLTPDGLEANQLYYAITGGALFANQIQLSRSLNNAISGTPIPIDIYNTNGGLLRVVSRVNDKAPNEIGHPIQYDPSNFNWYVNTSSSGNNTIRSGFITYRQFLITGESSKSYITRKIDTRSVNDRIYRFRYVIPKEYTIAREPSTNFIIQESRTSGISNSTEFSLVDNQIKKRNPKIIASVSYDSLNDLVTVTTETRHNFIVGDKVTLKNVKSSDNLTRLDNRAYNGINSVTAVLNSKQFQYSVDTTLGTFVDTSSTRNETLPYVYRQEYKNTFYIYSIDKLQTHEYNKTDGIYHLTCLTSNVSPSDTYFDHYNFSQSPANLYPTLDRDNFNSDPQSSISNAKNDLLGKVVINDRQNSITKETVSTFLRNNRIGIAVTGAANNAGITSIFTEVDHNLNSVRSLSIVSAGANYGYAGITTVLYNAKLVGVGITGEGATANVSVSAAGAIDGVTVVDGGSAYGIGMTMTVIGVATQASWSPAVVQVTAINNNIGDAIEVVGVGTTGNRTNSGYNGVYRIAGITSSKIITYDNGSNPGIYTGSTGINGYVRLTDEVTVATGIEYSSTATGIVTVTTSQPHGLVAGNKFTVVGAAQTVYNGTFLIATRLSVNSFNFFIGAGVTNPAFTGSCFILSGATESRSADTALADEKIANRMIPFYAGIGTISSAGITTTGTSITLSGSIVGFNTGDFLQIDNEIVRISGSINTATNTADIIRGVLGTDADAHEANSLARKIRVIPTELRRHSIIRASGHTFEYVGFGHGNYAVALPSRQNRILSREEQFLTQSVQCDGGTAAYTGTNDSGDFYIGNKIISPINNTEISINVPTETYLGINDSSLSVTYDDITVNNSLKVTGGIGNFQSSEFRGPVSLYKKLTSSATDGIEAIKLELKGNATQVRSYTVGISTPVTVVTQGDVTFNSTPEVGKYLGWVYTGAATGWKRYGLVSQETNSTVITPDKIGIGTPQPQDLLQISGGGAIFDQLRVTGIVTFDNGGSVNRIALGDVQNVGFTTFITGSGVYAQPGVGISFAGITTFGGSATSRVAITTNTSVSVAGVSTFTGNVKMGNLEVDTINIVFPDGFTGTAAASKNIITTGVSTNAAHYLSFVASSTGVNQAGGGEKVYVDPGISYNPSTNNLVVGGSVTASTFSGNLVNTLTLNTSGTGLSGSTTFNNSGAATFTVTSNATSANTASTIVARDGSGNFNAGTINASLSGNVSGNVTGNLTGNVNSIGLSTLPYISGTDLTVGVATISNRLDASGSLAVTGLTTFFSAVQAPSITVTGLTSTSSLFVTGLATFEGNTTFGNANTDTVTFNAKLASSILPQTANSGDIGAANERFANVYANNFVGLAATSTKLATPRNFNLTGDVTASAVAFDGTSAVQLTTAYAAGSIENADISGSAAIAISKLAHSTISGVSLGNNLTNITFNNGGGGNGSGTNYNGSAAIIVSYNTIGAAAANGTNASGTGWNISILGSSGATTSSLTFTNTGGGNGSGTTFDGSAARTISYNTIGAAAANGTNASGTGWNISILGSSNSCSGNASSASSVQVNTITSGQYYLMGSSGGGGNTYLPHIDLDFYYSGSTLFATNLQVTTQITITSDLSLKTNIKPLEGSLAKILGLRGVEYDRIDCDKHQLGLIAQEVEEVLPEIISEDDKGLKTVEYTAIIPVLIEAIKELKAEIDELKKTK